MSTIRIETTIDSDTLYLPQLKPLVGKSVEIIVRERATPNFLRRPVTGRPLKRRFADWKTIISTRIARLANKNAVAQTGTVHDVA